MYQGDGKECMINDARTGRYDDVLQHLNNGVPVDGVDQYGETSLKWAARNGNYNICQLLLDRGAVADREDYGGWTALQVSIFLYSTFRVVLETFL